VVLVAVAIGCQTTGDPNAPGWFNNGEYESTVRPAAQRDLKQKQDAAAAEGERYAALMSRQRRLQADIDSLQNVLDQTLRDMPTASPSAQLALDWSDSRARLKHLNDAMHASDTKPTTEAELAARESEAAQLRQTVERLKKDIDALQKIRSP